MSPGGWRALRTAGIVGGAAAGVAGAAYAVERAVVAGVRRRPDPDAGKPLVPPFDEAVRSPSHDGGSIYTISRGSGPAIVFSHGVTLSVRVWVKQFEDLPQRRFRTIAFDHRGHGDSECGDSGHSVENLAEDVRTVLERMDVRDAILVGHSMGGIAAMAFAIRHPDVAARRLRGMVLMSTLAKTHLGRSARLRGVAQQFAGQGPGAAQLMAQQNLGFFLARLSFGRDPQPSHVELTRQMVAACAADASREAIQMIMGVDLTDELDRIRVPTLVLSGTADVLAPPSESRFIAERIPGARLEAFKGAGHMLMFERTQEVDDLIAGFARDLGVGSPFRRLWPRRGLVRAPRWWRARVAS